MLNDQVVATRSLGGLDPVAQLARHAVDGGRTQKRRCGERGSVRREQQHVRDHPRRPVPLDVELLVALELYPVDVVHIGRRGERTAHADHGVQARGHPGECVVIGCGARPMERGSPSRARRTRTSRARVPTSLHHERPPTGSRVIDYPRKALLAGISILPRTRRQGTAHTKTRHQGGSSSDTLGCVRGLEPPAFGATVRRSNQLSYTHRIQLARPEGFEPPT